MADQLSPLKRFHSIYLRELWGKLSPARPRAALARLWLLPPEHPWHPERLLRQSQELRLSHLLRARLLRRRGAYPWRQRGQHLWRRQVQESPARQRGQVPQAQEPLPVQARSREPEWPEPEAQVCLARPPEWRLPAP